MGVAAQHRGNAVIRRQLWAELDERRAHEDALRAVQIAENCNAFVSQALDYRVEPRGLRQKTVERAKSRRGWAQWSSRTEH